MTDDAAIAGAQPTPELLVGGVKRRLAFIDVLRALAVISVLAVHVHEYWVRRPGGHGAAFVLDRIAAQGAAGVDLFIVLSGFCMTYPLLRGRATGVADIDPLRFYRRRAIRLLPAYYLALLVVVLLTQLPDVRGRLVARAVDVGDVLAHVLLVQPFLPGRIGAINGPLWSISLEFTLYLVFPLVLLVLRRWGWFTLMTASLVLALGWFVAAAVAQRWTSDADVALNMHYWLPAHVFEFVLGMKAADLVCRPRAGQARRAAQLLPVAVIAGVAGTTIESEALRILGWGVAAFALTLVASVAVDGRRLRRVGWAAAQLGVVSYSFYLLHQPCMLLVAPEIRDLGLSPVVTYLVLLPLAVMAMYVVAWGFFRLVERPFLLAGSMKDAIRTPSPPDAQGTVSPGRLAK